MNDENCSVRDFCIGCGSEIPTTEVRAAHRCPVCLVGHFSKPVTLDGREITMEQLTNRVSLQAGARSIYRNEGN